MCSRQYLLIFFINNLDCEGEILAKPGVVITWIPTWEHNWERNTTTLVQMLKRRCENGPWLLLFIQFVPVALADDAETLVELVLSTPDTLIMLLATLHRLIAIYVALIWHPHNYPQSWPHPHQFHTDWTAALGCQDVVFDLSRWKLLKLFLCDKSTLQISQKLDDLNIISESFPHHLL